jgi:hypothetical protein
MSWKEKTPRPNWTRGCDCGSPDARASGRSRRVTASQLRVGWSSWIDDRSSWIDGRSRWRGRSFDSASGVNWSDRCSWIDCWRGRFGWSRRSWSVCFVSRWGRGSWWGGSWWSCSWLATDEQGQRQQSEVLLHGNLPQSGPRSLFRAERQGQFRPILLSSRETHVLSCGLSNSRE